MKVSVMNSEVTHAIPTTEMDCEVIHAIPTTAEDLDVIHLIIMVTQDQTVKSRVVTAGETYSNLRGHRRPRAFPRSTTSRDEQLKQGL